MRRANGTIQIFTFKEGLMSAVAHDLRVSLKTFDVTLDGSVVQAEFDLTSLVVDGPMHNGALQADQYDASKKADVAKAMHGEVLHTDKHPKASYSGTATPVADGYRVEGQLQLAGKTQPLAFDVRNEGGTYRAEFDLQPSRWAIAQYKAMLGAIKLKDLFKVQVALTES
jgi:polyisoprenoid-binding protein YceI